MQATFTSTAAVRAHASRPWNPAVFVLSGVENGLVTSTDESAATMAYRVVVPAVGIPCVVAKQDRPPRGEPR
jgi:hypothetical protein